MHATGVGIGLIGFMVTWIVGARITERILDTPTSAYVAMVVAVVTGTIVTIVATRRLGRTDHHLDRVGQASFSNERTSM